ncbi:putative 50S ribosomal protein L12, chloroplastic-like [Capsicum annuum]|uniref:Uncharacterized protein n=1 Tax=Capsicum annuum TaxID=4072 RepID=A0A1U8FQE7_CAPAN|nr:uncharacterized protein LOC107860190 [Capsicum annuum]KAF3613841.1 putative 50S ribosomal protein L12, chloroplastic-like [Capsicum annuum]KAF3621175.1 putative 50S ribosomal protein L12, chloroplastic-like [Capsicum annuum]PHT91497.1 hypothetical protein T459_06610 [Capsicum annuum]
MGGDRSSSSEEDGDADWRAAIDSVAATTTFSKAHSSATATTNGESVAQEDEIDTIKQPQKLKHYQIKALKTLEDMLDKSIEIVREVDHASQEDTPSTNGGGIRLFKRAPPGIVFDHTDELQQPRKKPRIRPGKEFEENSEEFKYRIKSIAVDGMDILAASKNACQKSLARLEAREAAVKAAAKREEERVAALKKIRGERWLPSVARDMQLRLQRR